MNSKLLHELPQRVGALLRRPEPLPGNSVRLLAGGPAFYPRMLAAVAAAQTEVLVATYLWESDALGRKMVAELCRAARRGLCVSVLVDAVGGRGLASADRHALEQAGARFAEYHPVTYSSRLFRRLHKKLLVVDGECAYTGGAGFSQRWLDEPPEEWWDVMVELRGPILSLLSRDFKREWRRAKGGRFRSSPARVATAGEETLTALVSRNGRPQLRRRLHRAVLQAEKRIDITAAYFVPGLGLRRALKRAAERGVRVRLLLPGRRTDHDAVRHAGRRHYSSLLKRGAEIHEWQRGMLHAKYAIIDDEWGYVGSSNLDNWSLRFNAELDISFGRGLALQALAAQFEEDLASTRLIDLETWRDRPLSLRLAETFFGWFDPLL